jgi:hypothetical protein
MTGLSGPSDPSESLQRRARNQAHTLTFTKDQPTPMQTENNTAAELFKQSEQLQTDARDIRDRLSNFYKSAGALKRLAVQIADQLNPEPIRQVTNGR